MYRTTMYNRFDIWGSGPRNMEFQSVFTVNLRFLVKHFSKKIIFFKTRKNSYMGPLCITDLKYEGYDKEIWSFGMFLPQTGDFR
jgi:hypothetical protein